MARSLKNIGTLTLFAALCYVLGDSEVHGQRVHDIKMSRHELDRDTSEQRFYQKYGKIFDSSNSSTDSNSTSVANSTSSSNSTSTSNATIDNQNYTQGSFSSFYGLEYVGNIYMGSDFQNIPLVFDTGSDWLWMASTLCRTCEFAPSLYDPAGSDTFVAVTESDTRIAYGLGSAAGYIGQDQACLVEGDESSCSQDNQFMMVTRAHKMQSLNGDGLLGLCPYPYEENLPTFFQNLRDYDVIDQTVFAMYLTLQHEGSSIQWGGWDMKYAKDPNSTIVWNQLQNTDYWTLNMTGFSYGNSSVNQSTSYAIVDSGTSFVLMPSQEWDTVYDLWSKEMKCDDDDGLYYCECSQDDYDQYFDDFVFEFDGQNTFNLSKDYYIYYDPDEGQCNILLMEGDFGVMSMWILGDNFFQAYYAVFDYDNLTVGLTPSISYGDLLANENITADTQAIQDGPTNSFTQTESLQEDEITDISLNDVLYALSLIVVGMFAVEKLCSKYNIMGYNELQKDFVQNFNNDGSQPENQDDQDKKQVEEDDFQQII